MQRQIQPNKWSCLPTAFAIALNLPVEEIIASIGHDGSEIIFPDLKEPYCRRSFHIQELIDMCMLKQVAVIPIEKTLVSEAKDHQFTLTVKCNRFTNYLTNYSGVLTGIGKITKQPHAVAWDTRHVFDPNGYVYSIDNFTVNMFLIIVNFNKTEKSI